MTETQHATHEAHTHVHGVGCGHVAVPHQGHTDYVHDDGHIHKIDGDHVDECVPAQHVMHEAHTHEHGPDCGHVAVPHQGHVDYVHDGHRHASHAGHWDEH